MDDVAGTAFILVRPEFLGNIGAVARVLKNFGFSNLRLVAPPRNYKDAEARKMAVGAFDVLKSAQVFSTLSDALADIEVAIGTTSGKQRDMQTLTLQDAHARLAPGRRTAVVFGSERDGLTRDELLRCHFAVTIPCAPEFPALNVAQAVAICAYELRRSGVNYSAPTAKIEAQLQSHTCPGSGTSGAADDELFARLAVVLDRIEFTRTYNRTQIIAELRSLYQRAQPTAREHDLLSGVLHRLEQKLQG